MGSAVCLQIGDYVHQLGAELWADSHTKIGFAFPLLIEDS